MKNFIIIGGPTASGKSALAIELARQINGEIINGDSVAMYQGFDIGTAKPSKEEQSGVPHHLFDILTPNEEMDAARYREIAINLIEKIQSHHKTPILVGGSGLYLRAVMGDSFHDLPHDEKLRKSISEKSADELYEMLQKLDPKRAQKVHKNDHFRLARAIEIYSLTGKTLDELTSLQQNSIHSEQYKSMVILIDPNRQVLHERIALRTKKMIADGIVDEVKGLLDQGAPRNAKPFSAIGYKEVLDYLDGEITLSRLEEKILFATRQLAKRQCTWFKKVPHLIKVEHPSLTPEHLLTIKNSLNL
jgi:tRNA dimethylallyltransferase